MELSIADRCRTRLRPFLTRHLLAAHAILRPALQDLSVAIVDSREMARVHRRFSGIPGATDVLTFELDHDGKNRVTSGEIIVCAPFASARAGERGVPFRSELLLYCVHGVLHLCGYEDKTRRGFVRMHRAEDMILSQLGVGPVFAPPAGRQGGRSSLR